MTWVMVSYPHVDPPEIQVQLSLLMELRKELMDIVTVSGST